MTRIVVLPSAEEDLAEIWRYSNDRWSTAQANAYIHQIDRVLADLASGRRRGRPARSIRLGYLHYKVGAHNIYFRDTDDAIEIVRVLHERMDAARHLD